MLFPACCGVDLEPGGGLCIVPAHLLPQCISVCLNVQELFSSVRSPRTVEMQKTTGGSLISSLSLLSLQPCTERLSSFERPVVMPT